MDSPEGTYVDRPERLCRLIMDFAETNDAGNPKYIALRGHPFKYMMPMNQWQGIDGTYWISLGDIAYEANAFTDPAIDAFRQSKPMFFGTLLLPRERVSPGALEVADDQATTVTPKE